MLPSRKFLFLLLYLQHLQCGIYISYVTYTYITYITYINEDTYLHYDTLQSLTLLLKKKDLQIFFLFKYYIFPFFKEKKKQKKLL